MINARNSKHLAFADPPYPGRAHLYADHPDFAGEVDHHELIIRLKRDYDGWALSTSAEALHWILPLCPPGHRVIAWVKRVFEWLGARPGDRFDDLFPGSGQVLATWHDWTEQPGLFLGRSVAAEKRAERRARARADAPSLLPGDAS